jgi:cystathionine gamma-synthase
MANPEFQYPHAAQLHPESIVVSAGRPARAAGAPLNVGIELSTSFHNDPAGNLYIRDMGSETTRAFEEALGALEGGYALAFSSGVAATSAVLDALVPAGGAVVAPWTQYSGTSALFAGAEEQGRLTVRWVDMADTDAATKAFDGAALVWIESPGNPMLSVVDLPTLVDVAHRVGAIVVVDSTFNTPMVLTPLGHGVDVVLHSATKYLAGHSDALLGCLVTRNANLERRLRTRRTQSGAMPGALESYLAVRGLRTLAIRMERAQSNAMELAIRLRAHERVTTVRYSGLADDPYHDRTARLHNGFGAMISFQVDGGPDHADAVCHAVRLITHATSLGGVESLIERRAMHALDAARGVPSDLLRLSVGIENVEDLWDDLSNALRH